MGPEATGDELWWSPEMYEIFGVDAATHSPSFEGIYDAFDPGSSRHIQRLVESWRSGAPPGTAAG